MMTLEQWDEHHRSASSLLAEAAGWGTRIDQSNPDAMLAWARQYLPRILALRATVTVDAVLPRADQ